MRVVFRRDHRAKQSFQLSRSSQSWHVQPAWDMQRFMATEVAIRERDGSDERMEAIMTMKIRIGLGLGCCLTVATVLIVHSAAWAECSVQDRIELGKQGYDKEEVKRMCADDGKSDQTNDGDNFWEDLTKGVVKGLANGLTDSLTKGLNNAIVGTERGSGASSPAPDGARVCVTNVGTCQLAGVPVGSPCYCQAWDGSTFIGFSK